MVIRWLSNQWNRRKTSANERRLSAEVHRLTEALRGKQEELDTLAVENRIQQREISLLSLVHTRDRVRREKEITLESRRRGDAMVDEDTDLRAVG